MEEVKVGDTVLLCQLDGSTVPRLVVQVLSQTEVQLISFERGGSTFNAVTTPIYSRGTGPEQWELSSEKSQGFLEMFLTEGLRMANHPIMRELSSLLTVKLPADVEEVFFFVGNIYEDKDRQSPFYEVRHRNGPFNNDDSFYNLLMMGVQEGLRSTLYFLQQFSSLVEVVKVQGTTVISHVNPLQDGTLGLRAPALTTNYEGFILLSQATLDRLTSFFRYYFQIERAPRRGVTISNLYDLKGELRTRHGGDNKARQVVRLIDRHRAYLDTRLTGVGGSSRNRLAHQEYIDFTTPNIRYSVDGEVQVVLTSQGGLRADGEEELRYQFDQLRLFIIDMLYGFFADTLLET